MIWPISRYPYTDFNKVNLDWIMRKLKEQVSGLVASVNGKTGDVVLTASDVGALPTSYTPPVTSVNGNTGAVVTHDIPSGGTSGQVLAKVDSDDYNTHWITPSGGGGGAVDSVNGQTGTVVLTASDVGALPTSYTPPVTSVNSQTGAVSIAIPSKTSDLVNDSGFITSVPVTSVNSQTGAVTIAVPTKTSELANDSGFLTTVTAAPWSLAGTINNDPDTLNILVPTGAKEVLLAFRGTIGTAYRGTMVIPYDELPTSGSVYFGVNYTDGSNTVIKKRVTAYYSSGKIIQTDSTDTTVNVYYR